MTTAPIIHTKNIFRLYITLECNLDYRYSIHNFEQRTRITLGGQNLQMCVQLKV